MPPVRCGRAHRNEESSAPGNVDTVTSLRQQCAEKGLPTYGCWNALVAHLQQHAATNANTPSTSSQVEESRAPLTDLKIAVIQSIVSRSVEQAISEIATNSACIAVQALSVKLPSHGSNLASNIVVTGDNTDASTVIASHSSNPVNQATNSIPYGNGFHEVPVAYLKQIQLGEFFHLSKLIPKNMSVNPSLDWSAIDQQLWLMIFTISPDMLAQQYCNDLNRSGHCYGQACQYWHVCNKCHGPHSGRACLSVKFKQVDDEEHSGK